ncbi:MAG: ABC transporter substrate-binding protein [Acetobacteraceae bacterium]
MSSASSPILARVTRIGRRGIAGLIAAAALAVAAPGPARAAEEFVLGSYGGTIEQFLRKDVIPAFEKETGVKVTYVTGTALSLFSKVAATRNRPEIDLYWANDLTHAAGKQMGLYEKIDPKIITNLNELIDGAQDPQGIGVSTSIASTGIQYNTQKFKEAGWAPPTSWMDLWDPKYKGKVALYSISILYSQEFLGLISRLSGGSETNIAPGLKKIRELKDMGNIAAFATTPAEMDNIMAQGQAWITYNGGVRTLIMKSQGAPMEFVIPKEGAIRFSLYLDPIKGSKNLVPAQKFIQYFLRANVQEQIAEKIFYAPVNKNAKVSPELAKVIPHGDKAVSALVQLERDPMNRDLDSWIEQWNRTIETK